MSVKSVYDRQVAPASGELMNAFGLFLHLVPKNLVSWITGAVVRLRLPGPIGPWVVRRFAAAFKLNLDEAEMSLSSYATIEELFTRRLKPGLRPVSGLVSSPADGQLARSAACDAGTSVQAKGLSYSLFDLVYGTIAAASPDDAARRVKPDEFAWQTTVYLAPHNYHRVHSPFSGKITAVRYLPGELWPVNVPFVLRTPRLFARNERLVFDYEVEGGGRAFVVMVGALNVGRMVTPLVPDLVTNALSRQTGAKPRVHRYTEPRAVAQGDELGTFMLGSTAIVVYDRTVAERVKPVANLENRPILMGQSLCE